MPLNVVFLWAALRWTTARCRCRISRKTASYLGKCLLLWTVHGLAADGPTPAETSALSFTAIRYGISQGLPESGIIAGTATRDGRIWVGSSVGLYRYSAGSFSDFPPFANANLGLPAIRSVVEDSDGSLWTGTVHGLVRLGTNGVRLFDTTFGTPTNSVRGLLADPNGGVWMVAGERLCRVTPATNTAFNVPKLRAAVDVHNLTRGPQGIYVETDEGWHLFDVQKKQFAPHQAETEVTPGNRRGPVLFRSATQELWAGSRSRVVRRTPTGWEALPLGAMDGTEEIRILYEDGERAVWAVSEEDRIYRWNGKTWDRVVIANSPTPTDIRTLFHDHENNLWLCCRHSLTRLHPRTVTIIGRSQGMLNPEVWSVDQAQDGSMWMGTRQGIYQFVDGQVKRWVEVTNRPNGTLYVVLADQRGRVWAAATGRAVRSDPKLFRIEPNVGKRPISAPWLSNITLASLYEEKNGALWIGTVNGAYRFRVNSDDTAIEQEEHLLPGHDIRAIHRDNRGSVWLGSHGSGLWRIEADRTVHFHPANGFPSAYVWTIHEDKAGVHWVGSEQGLFRIDRDSVRSYNRKHGLPENTVNHILEDDSGYFWLSGLRGVHRISKQDLEALGESPSGRVSTLTLSDADGLIQSETNGERQPAGCQTRDGALWFPTVAGVARIQPRELLHARIIPRIQVTEVRSNDKTIFSESQLFSRRANASGRIQLTEGNAQQVEFVFDAHSFRQPTGIQFQHRLSGADTGWQPTERNNRMTYYRLKPGSYRFEVRAEGHAFSDLPQAQFSLPIHVSPYWWNNPAVWILGGFLGIATVTTFVRQKLERARTSAERHQKSLEAERTRIAKDLHDEVGASLTGLAMQAELSGQRVPIEMQAEFQRFSREARALVDKMREVIWTVNPACDNLESVVDHLVRIAETYLDNAGVRCRLDVPDELPRTTVRSEFRHQLLLFVKEAVNNAVKNGQATEVQMRVECAGSQIRVGIRDDGRGFNPEEAQPSPQLHSRIGLASMHTRIQNLGGQLQIVSTPGKGTEVTAVVPLQGAAPRESGTGRSTGFLNSFRDRIMGIKNDTK